jgi:uncharacterized protein YxeA
MKTIEQHVNEINERVKKYMNDNEVYIKSTCNSWSSDEHEAMNIIKDAYSKKGYKTASKYSFGVCDTYIYPKINIV